MWKNMTLTNTEIIEQTLIKLDGWVLDETITTEELTDLDYNKSITSKEILDFYKDAESYIKSYLQNPQPYTIPVYDTAVIFWTAGLIWEKYNVKKDSQLDETNPNPWGYGDKLIIQAKEMLKPFKSYSFTAF